MMGRTKASMTTVEIVEALLGHDGCRIGELADEPEFVKTTVYRHPLGFDDLMYVVNEGRYSSGVSISETEQANTGERTIRTNSRGSKPIPLTRRRQERSPLSLLATTDRDRRRLSPVVKNYSTSYGRFGSRDTRVHLDNQKTTSWKRC
ncbi:hypothetical protein RBH26_18905 [Natronolimnohabitans sp. A-GB9]|uniref:hypothetical protein n=1 Tax=Natronolimnohabitans sp. A-GB9 TaxID=3069757 RepID=UPI0027B2E517|nr:hypothetical protein [Natronolimnohabitans sp. A-GB9]MDQ2052534.1 hypothetical protein [Natronolimnohabitans sp. A-GB9]